MYKPALTDEQIDSIFKDPKNRLEHSPLLRQLVREYRRMKLELETIEDPPMLPPFHDHTKEVIIDGVHYAPIGSGMPFA